MDISVLLNENDEQIVRKILIEIRDQIKNRLRTISKSIEENIKDYISFCIKDSDFYNNLVYGKLRSDLGVVDPTMAMSQIIDALKSTVMVTTSDVRVYNNLGVQTTITVKAIPDDFQSVLSTSMAQYTTPNGQVVPWLSWVLFEGTSPVVLDYELVYGQPMFSRTGDAIMRMQPGSKWSIPSEFAGTVRNNFITQALNSNIPKLEEMLDKLLTGNI